MNKYNREELLYMFGYCFQVLKTVSDLDQAILTEQNKAYNGIMDNYDKIKKKMGTIYQITPTTRYSISIISKKATSVLEVAFSILIVVPF